MNRDVFIIFCILLCSVSNLAIANAGQIMAEVHLNKTVYEPYEPIIVIVKLTNDSSSPVIVPVSALTAGDNLLNFSCKIFSKETGKSVSNFFLPQAVCGTYQNSYFLVLEPGEYVQEAFNFSAKILRPDLDLIAKPGDYTMHIAWNYAQFGNENDTRLRLYPSFFQAAREAFDADLFYEDIEVAPLEFEITEPHWWNNEPLRDAVKGLSCRATTISSCGNRIRNYIKNTVDSETEALETFHKYMMFNFLTHKLFHGKYGMYGLYDNYDFEYPERASDDFLNQNDIEPLLKFFKEYQGGEPFLEELERLNIFSMYCHDREKADEDLKKYMEKYPGRVFPHLKATLVDASEEQHRRYHICKRKKAKATDENKRDLNPEHKEAVIGVDNLKIPDDKTQNNENEINDKHAQPNSYANADNNPISSSWDNKRVLLLVVFLIILIPLAFLLMKKFKNRN